MIDIKIIPSSLEKKVIVPTEEEQKIERKIKKWEAKYYKDLAEKGIEPNIIGLATYINSKGYRYYTGKDNYIKLNAYSNSKLNRINDKIQGIEPRKPNYKIFAIGHVVHQQVLEPELCSLEQYNLTPAVLRDCKGMIKSLKNFGPLKYALRNEKKEKAIIWFDEKTGELCKGRLDLVGKRKVRDIKTSGIWEDNIEEQFRKNAKKYGYHRQTAMYLDGAIKEEFQHIVVRKTAPYEVFEITYSSDEKCIKKARKEYQFLLKKAKELGL